MLEASLRIPGSVEILVAYTGGLDEVLKSGHMLEAIPMGEYLCDPSWLSSSFGGLQLFVLKIFQVVQDGYKKKNCLFIFTTSLYSIIHYEHNISKVRKIFTVCIKEKMDIVITRSADFFSFQMM